VQVLNPVQVVRRREYPVEARCLRRTQSHRCALPGSAAASPAISPTRQASDLQEYSSNYSQVIGYRRLTLEASNSGASSVDSRWLTTACNESPAESLRNRGDQLRSRRMPLVRSTLQPTHDRFRALATSAEATVADLSGDYQMESSRDEQPRFGRPPQRDSSCGRCRAVP
jgi:hypothetical protein